MRAMIISILLALTATANAGRKEGVTMPDTIRVGDKQLTLNGMGLREATWLKIDVYVAGLYLEHVSSNPNEIITSNQTKRMVMQFVRDVDRKDIVKAWSEGFARNATAPLPMLKARIDQLNAWMTDCPDGSVLVFTYVPGKGVFVDFNGRRKGVIAGDDFARSLFAIWVGPHPPTKDLRTGLLGRHP
jgi:Chalcone isomerase-like